LATITLCTVARSSLPGQLPCSVFCWRSKGYCVVALAGAGDSTLHTHPIIRHESLLSELNHLISSCSLLICQTQARPMGRRYAFDGLSSRWLHPTIVARDKFWRQARGDSGLVCVLCATHRVIPTQSNALRLAKNWLAPCCGW
jgi:hypothetical protein